MDHVSAWCPWVVGIVAGGDGVAVTEAAVASLDAHLSPADATHDVLGVLDGLGLGLGVLGGMLGVRGSWAVAVSCIAEITSRTVSPYPVRDVSDLLHVEPALL